MTGPSKAVNDKPLAVVRWGDAEYSSLRYYQNKRDYTPVDTLSVGFLVEYDDDKALLYTDYFADGDYRNEIVIPTPMIREIFILEYK